MKRLHKIFDFYLDASVHVAFAAFSLVNATGIALNIPVDTHLSWFVFFSTIVCYNFMKYGVEAKKYLLAANRYHKNIQVFSFIAFACSVYHLFFLKPEVWFCVAGLLVLTGLYALPLLPHAKNLRNLGGLKVFVVCLSWTVATVILPVVSEGNSSWWDAGIESLQRFLFIFILMVPFEIRDLAYDSKELKTLPQRYGVTHTKILGAFATLPFFFLGFFKNQVVMADLIGTGLLFLKLGVLMFFTKRNQPKYFASFWVEAIPITWWFLLMALQNLFQ